MASFAQPVDLDVLLGTDAADARALLGAAEVLTAVPLSRFRAPTDPRLAYRLELADGSAVKVRRVRNAECARRVVAILDAANEMDFGRVVGVRGRVLIEAWIAGTPAGSLPDRSVLVEAGALLGRLHAVTRVGGAEVRRREPASKEVHVLEGHLEELIAGRILTGAVRDDILLRAGMFRPAWFTDGVRHGDFCGENLILATDGHLCSVDNADCGFGALEADLARCLHRWNLDGAQRHALLQGYAQAGDPSRMIEHEVFWRIRALASSAAYRLRAGDYATSLLRVASLADLAIERTA
ncbi:MAG: phosphotransferase [Vicinamibacterales bacterium]